MRWRADVAVLLWMVAAPAACALHTPPLPQQEQTQMQIKRSRIPPPVVEPIHHAGVRYEQVRNGLVAGFDQMGGYLAAFSEETGEQLWTVKVYDNRRDPQMEGDVQDVFFRSMSLTPEGRLLVENERGARFLVDLTTQTVEPVG
jgi:hypothetical protein